MKIKEILSSSNSYFRLLSSLKNAKGIKKEGLILIGGKKILPELFQKQGKSGFENLVFSKDTQALADEWAKRFSLPQGVKLSPALLKELDVSNTQGPLAVFKAPVLPAYKVPQKGLNVFLALSDPANLGAALRSLKAFDAAQVVLLKEAAHAFLPRVTKAASGANLSLNLVSGPSIENLQLDHPLCLDMEGEALEKFIWPEVSCLVLGEEGKGLPSTLKKNGHALSITMNPEVESLSAPIALSIACHHQRCAALFGSNTALKG